MKRTFTFIVACFVVASLSGQNGRTKMTGLEKMHPFKSKIFASEIKEREIAKHHPNKNYTFNNQQVSKLKSAQIVKQKLDSIIYEGEGISSHTSQMEKKKSEFTYNSSGNVTQDIGFDWNANTGKWVAKSKVESTYDTNGNETLHISYNWDEGTMQWIGNTIWGKEEYTYNSSGDETQHIIYNWDKNTSQWIGSWRGVNNFDSNENITLNIQYNWDKNTSKWVGVVKSEYFYNSNGNETLSIEYEWDESTSKWVGTSKSESSYDSNENISQSISYSWDESTSKWVGYSKDNYAYDSNGNNIQEIGYDWDESTSKWVGYGMNEYTFNSNGNITLEIGYYWDENTSQWVVDSKYEYSYDSNGNITQYIVYILDEITGIWVADWKGVYTFDNSYSFDELWMPLSVSYDYFEEGILKNKLISAIDYSWNKNTGQWEIEYKESFYYSDQEFTSTINVLNADLKIYPNPVTNGFRISGLEEVSTIVLSDTNGRVWLSKEVANNEYVPTEVLSQGIYLVKINTGKSITVTKLVKK